MIPAPHLAGPVSFRSATGATGERIANLLRRAPYAVRAVYLPVGAAIALDHSFREGGGGAAYAGFRVRFRR